MTSRNIPIDITKGIAIVLMIIGHCTLFNGVPRYVIFTFHMPLFFIFSGYFYRNKPLLDAIKQGIHRLVIPYLSYAIITETIYFLLNEKDIIICLQEILFAHGGPKHTILFPTDTYLGSIWFLMAIFWCKIYYLIINTICKNNYYYKFAFAFLVSCLSIYLGKYIINMPLGLLTGASGLAFYSIGAILRNNPTRYIYTTIIIWGIAVSFHFTFVDMVNFDYRFYPIDFICAIGGSLTIYLISQLIALKCNMFISTAIAKLGVYSLEILCLHHLMLHICGIINCGQTVFFLANITIPIFLPFAWYKYKRTKSS